MRNSFFMLGLTAALIAGTMLTPALAAPRTDLNVALQLEPPNLDPTTGGAAAAIREVTYANIYEGLTRIDQNGSTLPDLAKSWDISPDGLTYTFHLQTGVKFHDGTPFSADDVKFSLDRDRAPNSVSAQKQLFATIKSVDVIDPATVKVTLTQPTGDFLYNMGWGDSVIVSPKTAATDATNPVGTGPFKFVDWVKGDHIDLAKNPDYWGTPAKLDKVTFKFISDPSAATSAILAGDVDVEPEFAAPESLDQIKADPRFAVTVGSTEGETVLSINNGHKPLDNILVREAIAHAIDRKAIIDGAMFGYGIPIGSHFPPRNPAYVDLTGLYPHDPAKAQALLVQAGYPRGFSVTLKLPPPSYARRGGEIVASQLAQVGIRVKIENLEWAQWLDQVYARHDFDMSIVVHIEPMDYDIYARDDYYFGYSNPEFKALIAALDDTLDAARRRDLLRRIQRKLADDAVNGFLFQYPRLAVWNKHLQGLGLDNVLSVVDLKNAHYDDEAAAASPAAPARAAELQSFRAMGWLSLLGVLVLLTAAARRFGVPFLAERAAVLIATLAAATAVVFIIVQVVPGDPVRYMMGLQADPGTATALRHQLGLDAAPLQRYWLWVAGLLHGDFGISYTYRIPIGSLIVERLQVSLPLTVYALLLSVAIAFPVGLAAAARSGSRVDVLLMGVTQLGLAVPNFWLGMLLSLLFAVGLHWVSAGGFPGWDAGFWTGIQALTLPAIALAMPQAAILARVLRGALIDTLHEDYIRTARAKGAGGRQVLWRHALPNALIPVLTIVGMQFSFLLAGGVIIENVFFLPGLGRLVFQAIVQRDLIVVQSVVVVLVFAVVMTTFLVDVGYVLVNPRLFAQERR